MAIPFIGYTASHYKINTDMYTGPLDLLLQLIEKEKLDITKLSLARVTDQYQEHLKELQENDPIEVSAFLVIAAQLVLIKSKTLLPQTSSDTQDSEVDIGDALIQQLITYKKYKQISKWLREREKNGFKTYLRISPPPNIIESLDFSNTSISDLSNYFIRLLYEKQEFQNLDHVINISLITINKRIKTILTNLKSNKRTNFLDILPNSNSHLEIVITFLAILELIKHHLIRAEQSDIFGDITIERIGDLNQTIDIKYQLKNGKSV